MKNFTLFFFFIFFTTVAFPQGGASIIVGNASTFNGSIVTIPVNLQLNSQGGIPHYLLQGKLHFNANKLKFRSASNGIGTLLHDAGWFLVSWAESGTINIFAFGFNDIVTNGTLLNLTFKVIDGNPSSGDIVGVPGEWLSNGTVQSINLIAAGGINYVLPFAPSEVRGDATLDFDITFDDVMALLFHLYVNTPLTGQALLNADATRNGVVDINDMLAMILFVAFGHWDYILPQIETGSSVTFADIQTTPDNLVEIPVSLINSEKVQAGEIIFNYNPGKISLQSYQSDIEDGFVYAAQPIEGRSVFVFAKENMESSNSGLGKIILRLKEGYPKDDTRITTQYRLNNGELKNGPVITFGITGVEVEENSEIPSVFTVLPNYPNPFNPSTVINYGLPEASLVSVKIYDMLGQEIKNLVNETKEAGSYSVQWNGDNNSGQKVTSGTYICRITAGNSHGSSGQVTHTMKMLMIK